MDPNSQDAKVALRIWAEFRWKLKIADRTWQEVDNFINEAIAECYSKIQDAEVRAEVINQFEMARNRVSEFNV